MRAAEAAICADDQGKFWHYHDTIFANHEGENEGAYSLDRLRKMAELIGLNADEFGSCMESHVHRDEVVAMYGEAQEVGIAQTPTLVVNSQTMPYRGYDDLKRVIDAALADA